MLARPDNWLFICSANVARSPTAEFLARKHGLRARSCGTVRNALTVTPMTSEILRWAHVIVCMMAEHRDALEAAAIPLRKKKVFLWNFEDDWGTPFHPEMIALMEPLLLKTIREYDEWHEGNAGHTATM